MTISQTVAQLDVERSTALAGLIGAQVVDQIWRMSRFCQLLRNSSGRDANIVAQSALV